MESKSQIISAPLIQDKILQIRGHKVLIDFDLSKIYGVTSKRLNEQVKRNHERFPEDFRFQLTPQEKLEVVAICDHLTPLKYSESLPYAFTEHGAIMAANVINSKQAVQMSVLVVKSFIKLREFLSSHKALERKILTLEDKYNKQFRVVFDAIRELMSPPKSSCRKIGFKVQHKKPKNLKSYPVL